jgi:AcrR family transcriptional regulator
LTKGERTRIRIVQAARRAFEKHGYQTTRVSDIVEEAHIAVGSFYTYFESREVLFLTLVRDFYADMAPVSLADALEEENAIDAIDRTIRSYFTFYRENARMMTLIESTSASIPEVNEIRLERRRVNVASNVRAIEQLQENGQIPQFLDPFVTANALLAMIANFTYSWLVLGEDFEVDDAAAHLTTLWARALGLDHTIADEHGRLLGQQT